MIKFPPLTEERRKEVVKVASRLCEDAKVSIRNVRSEFKKKIDLAKTEKTISEDDAKRQEWDLQKQIDHSIKEIENIFSLKEKDIMTV